LAENLELKAHRYLTEGRVTAVFVDHNRGSFNVRGSDDLPYTISFSGDWTCDCPARVPVCAHILACQQITHFNTDLSLYRPVDDDLTAELKAVLHADT
jgi:hypothetical protein